MTAAGPFGPNTRPTQKYAIVETKRDVPIKWIKIKEMQSRAIAPSVGLYARPHARAVRRRKKERR
jgi:hypothetical protein